MVNDWYTGNSAAQVGFDVELSRICPPRIGDDASISHKTELLRDRLGAALRIVDQLADVPVAATATHPVSEKEIRTLLKLRRKRSRVFGGDLFADPAWDILLELYASELGQYRMSVGALCEGAAVPATTALRWIHQLEQRGLIERRPDPTDGRRQFVMLSRDALEMMGEFFQTASLGIALI